MKKPCRLPKMLLTVLFLGVSSCAQVTVYDDEICADLGADGAHCAHTLVKKSRDVAKPEWDAERVGMLCMDSQAFTDQWTAIDAFCTANPSLCSYETRDNIAAAKARLRPMVGKALAARKKRK